MKESHAVRLRVTASFEEAFTGEVCLELIQTLRVLEGRREVWLAEVVGSSRRVIAKRFLAGSKQGKESKREVRGLQELDERGIRCPRLICTAEDNGGGIWVVLEYIEDSHELPELIFDSTNVDYRRRLIHDFLLTLTGHWRAGVHQTDLHLRNFLWNGQHVYTIDVGLIRFKRAPLSLRKKEGIFSEMLGRFSIFVRAEFLNVFSQFYKELNEEDLFFRIQSESFNRRIGRAEQNNLKRVWRKSQRNCSLFLVAKSGGRKLTCRRALDHALIDTLKNAPEELMRLGTRLKRGHTCTVQQFELEGRSIVLKRYNPKPISYRILHAFHAGRALRSWSNGIVMQHFGVPTVEPLALVEEFSGGILKRAYFLMERFDGENIYDYLNRTIEDEAAFEHALRCLSELFERMLDLRIVHGDLKAKNILINSAGLRLIDTDGLRFSVHPRLHLKYFKADYKRFLRNWSDGDRVQQALKERLSRIFGHE